MAGLFPGAEKEFPFILYAQSVPRPAWSGKRDFQRERLYEVYTFLTGSGDRRYEFPLACPGFPRDTADVACDRVTAGSLEGMHTQEMGSIGALRMYGLRANRLGGFNVGSVGVENQDNWGTTP